jgi:hypothetical protein
LVGLFEIGGHVVDGVGAAFFLETVEVLAPNMIVAGAISLESFAVTAHTFERIAEHAQEVCAILRREPSGSDHAPQPSFGVLELFLVHVHDDQGVIGHRVGRIGRQRLLGKAARFGRPFGSRGDRG